MNYIENLLKGQKVEWKTLGELGEFYGGLTGKNKNDFSEGNAKYVTYVNVFKNPALNFDINDFVKINESENQNKIQYGDILFTGSSETPDECGMSSVVNKKVEEDIYLNSFCFGFRLNEPSEFDPDFLKHIFRSFELRKQIGLTANGVTRFNVSKKRMEKVKIPIPLLAVQKEIANILDTFTTLEAELEAELDCRKRQYRHYRDTLLTFGDDVEWKTLGEITIYTQNIKWNENSDTYCYIDLTSVNLESNTIIATKEINYETAPSRAQKIVERDDVIFATTRPTQMRIALINNDYHGQIASTGYCVLRANQNQVLPKWIYFCLTTMDFKNYLEENQSGSAYPAISDGKLKEYKIPFPPLEEQKRIVNILDKFDALVNDISQGLPAEINARRKQYEYYREKLLSFPEN